MTMNRTAAITRNRSLALIGFLLLVVTVHCRCDLFSVLITELLEEGPHERGINNLLLGQDDLVLEEAPVLDHFFAHQYSDSDRERSADVICVYEDTEIRLGEVSLEPLPQEFTLFVQFLQKVVKVFRRELRDFVFVPPEVSQNVRTQS